jgi:hypothetical protein
MKSGKIDKKLQINKTTISNLSDAGMNLARGGRTMTWSCSMDVYTCVDECSAVIHCSVPCINA